MRAVYYHGGPAGIRGRIVPASETNARNASDLCPHLDTGHVRRDRVFLTTDYAAAVLFASAHRTPMVYVVLPDDDPAPDPDWTGDPGVSVQAAGATILRTIRPKGRHVGACRAALAHGWQ